VGEEVKRGRLREPASGPPLGEQVDELVSSGGLLVEHILSGAPVAPVDYSQETDEWVVLLSGAATLEVEGELTRLAPGDWLFLPAHTPHRLLETTPGTSWVAVHHEAIER
jgi:cupin 2 domain-containing protein